MLFGGLGILDMCGGFLVGVVTAACIVGIRRLRWNRFFIVFPIVLVPGFGVSIWLSYLLKMPYLPLAASLCIGQAIPSVCGVLLVKAVERVGAGKLVKTREA